MSVKTEDGKTVYTTDLPAEEGKPGFLGVFYALYLKLGHILESPDFSREPIRIHFMTGLLISMVPDVNLRAEIRKKKDDLHRELKAAYLKEKNLTTLNIDQENYLLVESSIQTIGHIQDYTDRFIGLSEKNKVSFIIDHNEDQADTREDPGPDLPEDLTNE